MPSLRDMGWLKELDSHYGLFDRIDTVAGAVQVVAQDRLAQRQEQWRISGQESYPPTPLPPLPSEEEGPRAPH